MYIIQGKYVILDLNFIETLGQTQTQLVLLIVWQNDLPLDNDNDMTFIVEVLCKTIVFLYRTDNDIVFIIL